MADIVSLMKLLDTTDATLAGGRSFTGTSYMFEGIFQFDTDLCRRHEGGKVPHYLRFSLNACARNPEQVVNFPNCLPCDVTVNLFVAKTMNILEVGCWSAELKILEHRDIFLRLRADGKKVAMCNECTITHSPKRVYYLTNDKVYKEKRYSQARRIREYFENLLSPMISPERYEGRIYASRTLTGCCPVPGECAPPQPQ